MFSLAGKFLRYVLPGLIRPMRVLWNQLIGFLFLVFAATIVIEGFRRSSAQEHGPAMLVLAVLFGLFLAWFGISSFLKARRISRTP